MVRVPNRPPGHQAGVARQVARRRVDSRGLERFLEIHARQDRRQPLGQHGLAGPGRADQQNVVPPRRRDGQRPLDVLLPAHVGAAAAEEGEAEDSDSSSALERFDLAEGILALTESSMQGAGEQLMLLATNTDALEASRERVGMAVKGLENLRRLFFSIIEHLRDTAERQIELGDGTESALALAESDAEALAAKVGPIAKRQGELANFTEQLAEALHEQSQQDPAQLIGEEAAADEAAAKEATMKLIQASELVLGASEDMNGAAEGLTTDAPVRETIRAQQDAAVKQLAEALALLQPPREQDQEGEQGDQQEQGQQEQDQQQQPQGQQEQEQQQQQGQPEQSEASQQQAQDPARMLQSVRDREAERHRRREGRSQQGYEPVERDW